MNKLFFILIWVLSSSLTAKEPIMAILESVDSPSLQKFTLNNNHLYCDVYGILSLDKVMQRDSVNVVCKKSLLTFYKQNPEAKYFPQKILKVQQMYHVAFRDNKCILFAQGERTLSELLLREGLAVVKPKFKDEEYRTIFLNAQKSAKREQKGIWSGSVARDCLAEIYKQ